MIRTDTAVRGFVVTLVTGILAVTFLPLGIAFAIIGAVSEPEAFFVARAHLRRSSGSTWPRSRSRGAARTKRRDAEEAAARTSRTTARVLEAEPTRTRASGR